MQRKRPDEHVIEPELEAAVFGELQFRGVRGVTEVGDRQPDEQDPTAVADPSNSAPQPRLLEGFIESSHWL